MLILCKLCILITLLGLDGKVKQGDFKEIEQAGLIEDLPDDDNVSEESLIEDKTEELDLSEPKAEENNEARDLQRQTGDITVYTYYFKSIGFLPLFWFLLFVVITAFSSEFSCWYNLC